MTRTRTIIEFLQKKGAIEILVEMGDGSKRHKQLKQTLLMSSSTLQRRLNAGKEHDIWTQTLEEQDDGYAAKVYQLTKRGEKIYKVANKNGLRLKHKQRRDMVRKIRKAESKTLIELSPPDADWLDELNVEIELEVADSQGRITQDW